ncbi:hypothetical protein [Jeotgalicoccus aerolatus]|uniref:Uncharacterized protein n=1 Tax=Jeotgalicoccus aerolatus TaxID=709510 RepID=A0ABS4HQ28_9STAP|nr:hypothetical protein [Jeotgalicoccus aerolatus]MBP1953025.1 hypothetical protein [Jeotgalicoccus aerolatus]GGE01896.1 hypothetical protein GCM10007273_13010 [Jeotgalicoccus aerolatus]
MIVSLFTKPPEGEQFEKMWETYTEKNEVGTPEFLPSDQLAVKQVNTSNIKLKTDKDIVSALLENNINSAKPFTQK